MTRPKTTQPAAVRMCGTGGSFETGRLAPGLSVRDETEEAGDMSRGDRGLTSGVSGERSEME